MSREVVSTSFARAGLLGNPSDGYHGKAIAFSIREFQATVTLRTSNRLEIKPAESDLNLSADSIHEMVAHFEKHGYYGGTRLLKAAIQQFHMFCSSRFQLHDDNFSVQYQSSIPRNVGMAGSSAIITATLKALARFYDLEIDPGVMATLALKVEKQRLGISAGLMDRVIQMLEGVAFMDFSPSTMHEEMGEWVGKYERIQPGPCESNLFVAWADKAAEPTEVLHNRLQSRFEDGDTDVRNAMIQFAAIAEQGKQALQNGDVDRLSELIDANFDLRASICQLPSLHRKMVELSRQAGGSAKFCGSGGAIVGIARDDKTFHKIQEALASIGCQVIRPTIRSDQENV